MVTKDASALIVDDEQVVCDVLRDELSEQGYRCTTVLSGNDALNQLAKQDFAIVLLDIRLPGISGMEVLRQMRSKQRSIVIMVTAVNDVDTAVEAMKLGASDYFVKPLDLDRVNTSIHVALQANQRLLERIGHQAPPCVGTEEEDKHVAGKCFDEMNAIARGVEARYDLLIGYSNTVTRTTVDAARQLDIPEKAIQRWVAARAKLDSDRNSAIRSSLDKLQRSPFAQLVMDLTDLDMPPPDLSKSQN